MPTSSGKDDTTRSDSSQQPLLQELLDAASGTPGTQGGLLIYTPAQGKALCPPGIGQSASTLICMHLLGRGWHQIRASTCSVVLFTATVYWRRGHLLGVGCLWPHLDATQDSPKVRHYKGCDYTCSNYPVTQNLCMVAHGRGWEVVFTEISN